MTEYPRTFLVLTPLRAPKNGVPKEFLECCVPPMAVLILLQLMEDGLV